MAGSDDACPGYAELHALSNFSFLRAASHPEELVRRAAELGYRAIAVTDECSLAGIVRAWEEARAVGIQLIVGSEFRLPEGTLVILATNREGYGRLSALITRCRMRAPKGGYRAEWAELLDPARLAHCLLLFRPPNGPDEHLARLASAHPGRVWLLAERRLDRPEEARRLAAEVAEAARLGVPAVAATGARMHHPGRQPLLDMLTAIRHHTCVQKAGLLLTANAEQHLRPRSRLARLYPPQLLRETLRIAERCHFDLGSLRYEYPAELVPEGLTAGEHLRNLVAAGVRRRFPGGMPEGLKAQLERELALIAELGYEHYFLTIEDIVRFARSRGILCQGRGSAANSIVCYCLGITEVDPRQVDLLLERFISRERAEPPDIDVDFEHERREEVIQYIYRRWGRERAGLAAAVVCYRPRSAIRDLGKALGLGQDYLDWLLGQIDRRDPDRPWAAQLEALTAACGDRRAGLLAHWAPQLVGFPRHLSLHVGGFVISAGPLSELVPTENAAMAGRSVIQWNKDDLEALGLLKVDILALGMLTAIRKALALIGPAPDRPLGIQEIPREDPATYAMLCKADSMGVFQVESRAQMNMLPRLQPRCYYDLVVQVAIVRPGPIQGDMVHPYLKRRQGLEPVSFPGPEVEQVLARTLGIPIFQEQVIKLAMVAAGFSGGEADQLRRSMAAWRRSGSLARHQQRLIEGMRARGYPESFARQICRQIEGFGEYGFPESHAASFAHLVYISAWLKRHHPAAFCCALLNSQPMGFYTPAQLVDDARRHGVEVRPLSLNESAWDCTLEGPPHRPALRLGLRLIRGLSRRAAEHIVNARPEGGFRSLGEARQKISLDRRSWTLLAASGALECFGEHRRQSHWNLLARPRRLELGGPTELPAGTACLAPPGETETLVQDLHHTGLSLGRHPFAILREQGHLRGCLTSIQLADARHGQIVRVAGIVRNRQQPGSAGGVTFVTLEDETGTINLLVWPATARAQRIPLLTAHLLQVTGTLERQDAIIHVIAGRLEDISALWRDLRPPSRDFR